MESRRHWIWNCQLRRISPGREWQGRHSRQREKCEQRWQGLKACGLFRNQCVAQCRRHSGSEGVVAGFGAGSCGALNARLKSTVAPSAQWGAPRAVPWAAVFCALTRGAASGDTAGRRRGRVGEAPQVEGRKGGLSSGEPGQSSVTECACLGRKRRGLKRTSELPPRVTVLQHRHRGAGCRMG